MTMRLRFRHGITNDSRARVERVDNVPTLSKTELHEQLRIAQDILSTLEDRSRKHPGRYTEPIAHARKQVDALERQLFIVQDKALSATIANAEQPHSVRLAALNKKNAEFWKQKVEDRAASSILASRQESHS